MWFSTIEEYHASKKDLQSWIRYVRHDRTTRTLLLFKRQVIIDQPYTQILPTTVRTITDNIVRFEGVVDGISEQQLPHNIHEPTQA